MVIDVHPHLYPPPFMQSLAAHGPRDGVSLTGDQPPFLCFEGIRFWRYTAAFHDVDARLREMDAAGVDRQVLSGGPPMVYWADPDLALQLCRIFNDEVAAVEPVFQAADARALPMFIHPINPAGHADIHDYRLDLAVAFPLETTIAAARLVYSGLAERCQMRA